MPESAPHSTPAWTQLETLVADIPGWSPLDQLFLLYTLTLASQGVPGDIVEVGSWCGRSAVVLGTAARLAGPARVHCADLFPDRSDWTRNPDGSFSFAVTIAGRTYGGYQEQTVWAEPFNAQIEPVYHASPRLLDRFTTTIRQAGLEEIVLPHRGDLATLLAAQGPDFRCRLAFLDGDHGYDAVCQDIDLIDRHLSPGGWLCFDDAFSSYTGVDRAISEKIIGNPRYDLCQQMTRKCFIARKVS